MTDGLFTAPDPAAAFEAARDAAVDIIREDGHPAQVRATVSALLEPFDGNTARIHLAGLLGGLAVEAVTDAQTLDELLYRLVQLTYAAEVGWPHIDPERTNSWK